MPDNLQEMIQATSLRLGISQFVIEKDLFVTQAISVVSQVPHQHFDLVFQGGTCLAKAHRIIQRMSEDCDFRMRLKTFSGAGTSKGARRDELRKFRHDLVMALRNHGFIIADEDLRTRNEGQFMSVRAQYKSAFPIVKGLKPYIALEFFLGNTKTPIENKPITTLVQQTLGDVGHGELPVNSVSVIETAAEKWVALTRRVAMTTQREHSRDDSLVRHLYDLYKIEQQGGFTAAFEGLAAAIVQEDRQYYKNHSSAYYLNPVQETLRAVDLLDKDNSWRDHWEQFMNTMVFEIHKPSYQEALSNLEKKTRIATEKLSLYLWDD